MAISRGGGTASLLIWPISLSTLSRLPPTTDAGETDGGGPSPLAVLDTMLARALIGSSILLVCRPIHLETAASFGLSGAGGGGDLRWVSVLNQPGVDPLQPDRGRARSALSTE